MLGAKVQKILTDHKWADPKVEPWTMTQLAAAIGISHQHLRRLIDFGRPQDIERIAKGLGVSPEQLTA